MATQLPSFTAASMRALADQLTTDKVMAELKECEKEARHAALKGENKVEICGLMVSPATCEKLLMRGFMVHLYPSTHPRMDPYTIISWNVDIPPQIEVDRSAFTAANMCFLMQRARSAVLAAELKKCEDHARQAASNGLREVDIIGFVASEATCQELRKRGFRVELHPSTHQLMDPATTLSW